MVVVGPAGGYLVGGKLDNLPAIRRPLAATTDGYLAQRTELRDSMGPDSCDGGWNDCISSLRVSRVD